MPSTATSLYLVFETANTETDFARLSRAIETVPVAALLISPAPGRPLDPGAVKPLIERAQSKGIATLLAAPESMARSLRADGVHVSWSDDVVQQFNDVRSAAHAPFMVGADAGRSRHDAMLLGEGGADYVGFGIPQHVEDRDKARERRLDLIAWWSEIFEVPVVAFDVETPKEAAELASAGADFVAVHLTAQIPVNEVDAWIRTFAAAISDPQSAASERL